MSDQTASIINTAIGALPAVLALIRGTHVANGAPAPTDAEIKAALESAIASSLTIDEQFLADHPGGG